ncbi:GAF domain-containing protein (plasmid) [Halorarum halophilum]|uniref:histidine kinase n=1 Tax=Halorarum halophilum TaxID=2743090 RepID=A0A7D5GPG4_9EURY|nr:GAF domain-containing protein [Halobaculum halophilum]QLG29927.1 GAF domain-containing protein [Halobaculum halophilum]
MKVFTRTDRLHQWSVVGVGLLLCVVIVGTVALSDLEFTTQHLQVGIPILLTLGLATFGGWLARSNMPHTYVRRIALWSLAGAAILGSFAAWEMYTHLLEGDSLVETLHELLLGLAEGATVGSVVGYYDARRKDHYLASEQAKQAISASMDGIAILDDDGEYESVNQAHADVYGYDDPDAFLGENWQLCYTEEEAAHIQDTILPEVNADGSWRGELTGQRRDESTFPQEITLSARPAGGLVCIVRDITERKAQEDRLRALHTVTREFLAAETAHEITTEIVTIADEMLGHSLIAVWEYDTDSEALLPLGMTDSATQVAAQAGLDGLPSFEVGSAEMEIFKDNEPVLIEDYTTLENRQVTDVPLGSALYIPLGDYGLVSIGSTEQGTIDDIDRFLAEILVSNATAAIERVEREQELGNREQRLRTIVENMPVILFAIDQDREITLQVGKGLEQVGVEQNQMVGSTVEEMFDNSAVITDAIDRSLEGELVDVTVDVWGRTYQVWYQPIESKDEVTNVLGVAMDVTERQKRERGIRALHDATREMMQETDPETICQIAVDTAEDALELPLSAIWLRTDDNPRLEPVALSDQASAFIDNPPVFEPGDSISWQVYEKGMPRIFDDVSQEPNRHNLMTEVRSELIVPIGEYGVLGSGSTDIGRFEETDLGLAKLLAANTRAALDRAEREAALQLKTDQMEFFNSILRHDVLNGMTVIRGRAKFLTDELDGQQLQDAETIINWSDDIVTIIKRVRLVLETLTGIGDPQLEPVDLAETLRAEVDRVQATYPDVTFEIAIPTAVTVRANELLGEVLGNVITNAIDHNDTDGLRVSVTVDDPDETDECILVRIADNGRGVPRDIKEAIFRREETGHAKSTGSGFGLFFVDSMVAEYGGDVWVEDNEPQGAVFVIELPTP